MTLGTLLPLVVLAIAFWFLIVRPAKARQNAAAAVVSRLAPGVEVMTTSGLFGTVVGVEGDKVDLEVADGVRVRFLSAAIARVEEAAEPVGTAAADRPSILEGDTPEG